MNRSTIAPSQHYNNRPNSARIKARKIRKNKKTMCHTDAGSSTQNALVNNHCALARASVCVCMYMYVCVCVWGTDVTAATSHVKIPGVIVFDRRDDRLDKLQEYHDVLVHPETGTALRDRLDQLLHHFRLTTRMDRGHQHPARQMWVHLHRHGFLHVVLAEVLKHLLLGQHRSILIVATQPQATGLIQFVVGDLQIVRSCLDDVRRGGICGFDVFSVDN